MADLERSKTTGLHGTVTFSEKVKKNDKSADLNELMIYKYDAINHGEYDSNADQRH